MLDSKPYKGVRDFYPDDWKKQQYMFDTQRAVLTRAGFEEFQASPLEHTEIYEKKGNEEIIRDQTYTFTDRGDRRVTLRPEITPTLARMVSEKRKTLTFPLRWFSIGNRFRYERMQRGRLREFYQTDIDIIGAPEGPADIEILLTASKVLRAFGATPDHFTIRINSRTLLNTACTQVGLTSPEEIKNFFGLLDRKNKMTSDEWSESTKNIPNPLKAIEENTDPALRAEREKIETLIATVQSLGVTNISFDPTIVRGFDYYSGIVFEAVDTHKDNPRALLGGGRYDRLVELFTSDAIPCVGFAIGDVGFLNFLETHNLLPDTQQKQMLYLATASLSNTTKALELSEHLQAKGICAWTNLLDKKVKDQIKDALKRGASHFAVYGDDEEKSQKLTIKNLLTQESATLSFASITSLE
jgi:histidyl-tRNA synthetase